MAQVHLLAICYRLCSPEEIGEASKAKFRPAGLSTLGYYVDSTIDQSRTLVKPWVPDFNTLIVEPSAVKTGPLRDPEEENDNERKLSLGFSNLANHLRRGARFIYTERLFRQEVATCSAGTGAASH